ncbi:hypothetical protein RHGRI_037674 [Rhododendron griersonianum]|uniref:SGNH hydrolase-type esterase domain-containing protein n=1 Tax=Rhododendron griersonianum TaxID=479676 RepID=A0AAV6HWJ6_9ERIC|nr:hypothetical protein RHGRI_037674 [Rhododendron griersonianum]
MLKLFNWYEKKSIEHGKTQNVGESFRSEKSSKEYMNFCDEMDDEFERHMEEENNMVDVVLRGYSGYNTRWILAVMDRVFPVEMDEGSSHVPEAMTVFFGANDACLPDRCAAFQHVPVDEYKHNLRSIVSYLKKRWPATHVILITPPPIDEDRRLLHPNVENLLRLPERTNEATGAYARACTAVAEESGIPVVDLWNKMLEFPDWKKAYLRDANRRQAVKGTEARPKDQVGGGSRIIATHRRRGACPLRNQKPTRRKLTANGETGSNEADSRRIISGNRIVFEEVIKKLSDAGLSLETLKARKELLKWYLFVGAYEPHVGRSRLRILGKTKTNFDFLAVYHLWMERNRRSFKRVCLDSHAVISRAASDLRILISSWKMKRSDENRDGLHLTESGNRIVFEEVIKKLSDAGLSLETLKVDLPLIAAIDPNDPLKAFHEGDRP